ncbi:hypothetical protein [Nocardioides sp.]|uniref:hypothetical protein n=1 Tax=Nocardioides sp. TaxID=35761 RepID=UPI0035664DE9
MSRVSAAQREWGSGLTSYGIPKRPCPTGCGARFFTRVGVEEHVRLGCTTGSPVHCRKLPSKAQTAARRATGLAVTARTNARRVQCACGKVSTPAGIGLHQHYSGHVGRTELGEPLAAAG